MMATPSDNERMLFANALEALRIIDSAYSPQPVSDKAQQVYGLIRDAVENAVTHGYDDVSIANVTDEIVRLFDE